jgi:intracellular sulfur oxidation DsrE/DsrF family protein
VKFESTLKSVAVALTMTLALASAGNAMADEAKKEHNAVLHVNQNDTVAWNQALNNATNMLKAMGKDKLNVEIVMNGAGLDMVKLESPVAGRIPDVLAAGVELKACGQTMKAAHVTAEDLAPGVQVVPGGMAEILQKEEAGWSYIKM